MRQPVCSVLAVAAVAGCSDPARPLHPQEPAALSRARVGVAPPPAYDVVAYTSTHGGSSSRGNALNERGWVAGFSSLPNGTRHAALWTRLPHGGAVTDLGTLGGPNSSVAWHGINNRGLVVGISQTGTPDPLGEAWSCAAFFAAQRTGPTCLGFVWEDGVMRALPTLGGNNGYAAAVNARGQVVGWAETPVHDPTCTAPQVLQFRAVVWEPRRGTTEELRPLAGDSASAATAINASGTVVGISGRCDQAVGRFTAQHAVVWRRGQVVELPNLGGTSWHTPTAINERGDVVGFSNPAAPEDLTGGFVARAVLWPKEGGIVDLGVLPGDQTSQAQGVNNRGQVVGVSCGATGCRAFLWDDGVLYDLNALVGSGGGLQLISARDISESGAITGDAREPGTGRLLPYVATPGRGTP